MVARRGFMLIVVGGLLLACVAYCLIAPNQYEAGARIALLAAPAGNLNLDGARDANSAAFASGQTQLETLANVFRSDQLAWNVITVKRLYAVPAFSTHFAKKFPAFRMGSPSPDAQAYLLERFQQCLNVRTLPRTLILQIRFRSRDPALSAVVVNTLIEAYIERSAESRIEATTEATGLLNAQLTVLKTRVDKDSARLIAFQKEHGLLDTPETLANGQPTDVQHTAALAEIDDLSRDLVGATSDRILREAQYRAAQRGNPELVIASDPRLLAQSASFATALLQQLHARHSGLEEEASQLSTEHGPSFPRVVEIRAQLKDLDRQISAEDAKLVRQFKEAWETAGEREKLLRQNLEKNTAIGMKLNAAATTLAAMRQEANASHELYMRALDKAEEAGLAAGVHSSNIEIVDYARQPVKPISPDLPIYLAITLVVSLWVALGGALLLESFSPYSRNVMVVLLLAVTAFAAQLGAQAPTPSTSGLPTGAARIPQSVETRSRPAASDSPTVWGAAQGIPSAADPALLAASSLVSAPLSPGDVLEISEYHTPEFRSAVRVSETGTVTMPLVGEVLVGGLTQRAAARAIEASLVDRGMLLHPQVNVAVTTYATLDVSVMGEVTRPGIYPLTAHHRLLDVISAASGLTPNAGSLVTVLHRDDQQPATAIVLKQSGATSADSNPELAPGDTVQVSRAGLVYVIGDVIRPGGFPVDPSQRLTALRALTLAWGPTQNASLSNAVLIREQQGGRTLTTLNLKRLLRGQDPDLTIQDRDILFVPDSTARNLWNRTMESIVQSAAGVSIYSGLVYSQRF
jgi:polysaccharide export outer membrane protein